MVAAGPQTLLALLTGKLTRVPPAGRVALGEGRARRVQHTERHHHRQDGQPCIHSRIPSSITPSRALNKLSKVSRPAGLERQDNAGPQR